MSQQNWYPFYGLTGGGAGALDSQNGDGLNDGDKAIVILEDGVYFYVLDAYSGLSENSPKVITPDLNYGTKRWILVSKTILLPQFNRILCSRNETISGTMSDGGFIGGHSHSMDTEVDRSLILGGYNHTMEYDIENCLLIGGNYNTLTDDVFNSVILGGHSNLMDDQVETSAIIAAQNSEILDGVTKSVIFGGSYNEVNRDIENCVLFGGQSNTLFDILSNCGIIGGNNNTIENDCEKSFIIGGYYNKCYWDILHSIILGGYGNRFDYDVQGGAAVGGWENWMGRSTNCSAFLGGHFSGIRSNSHKCVILGSHKSEIIETEEAAILSGDSNSLHEADRTVILGGYNNHAKQTQNSSLTGNDNVVGHEDNLYATGSYSFANITGQRTFANGKFSHVGDAQISEFVLKAETLDGTELEIPINDTISYIPVMTAKTCRFDIHAVARQTGGIDGNVGESAIWKISGAVRNIGASFTKKRVTFSGVPVNGDSITIGTNIYYFANDPNYTLNSVYIGATAAACASNFAYAARHDLNIMDAQVDGAQVILTVFPNLGSSGDSLTFAETSPYITITTESSWNSGTVSFLGTPQGVGQPNEYDCDIAIQAQGTISILGLPVADETLIIDSQTFIWKALRTTTGEVTIGADAGECVTNLIEAIGLDLTTVTAEDGTGDTVIVTSVVKGEDGNLITFTESSTNVLFDGSGTLGGTTEGENKSYFWEMNLEVDDVNKGLKLLITGEEDKTIHWNSKISFVEVG